MTTFDGIWGFLKESDSHKSEIILADRSWCLPQPNPADITIYLGLFGLASKVTPFEEERQALTLTPSEGVSVLGSNYGTDFVFERIWVYPALFELGFIVEQSTQTIQVWNAYRSETKDITDISSTGTSGTYIDTSGLPFTLPVFGEKNYSLIVYEQGPPIQKTEWNFTIGGQIFDVDVTGVRVVAFAVEPNWDRKITQKYMFYSTIFTSQKLVEQRRPLKQTSTFSTSFAADVSELQKQKITNILRYGKDKVFGVPIFSELFTPTTLSQGSSTIVVSQDLSGYYNLNNRTDYIIICDFSTALGEIKKVSGIATNTITVDQDVVNSFTLNSTLIFSCAFCYLRAYKANVFTDELNELLLDFVEYIKD